MIPLLLTALLLTLAHCHEPLLEPTDELQPMDVKMGYEDVVMNEQTDLDQEVESQTVEEERQFISARVVCPSGCCTEGSKCEKLGGECYPQSSTQRCHHASLAPDLCGTSRCRCCIKCSSGSYCGKVDGVCRKECGCYPTEYADVFNPCPNTNGCSCCRRCTTTTTCRTGGKDPGYCVGNVQHFLNSGYYPSSSPCKENKCRCVRRCRTTSSCREHNGYCTRKDVQCRTGYTSFSCWCVNESTCHCCIPDTTAKAQSLKCPTPTTKDLQ
ncbi:hypothetical protein Pcinc_009912 [Petrolisthes cinctipes]|uniref:Thyroglobulin type-1 domain-containing protein n=1 Tax=Petrolisthes cinctipes TaxID=88211 RepID=A0AAE1KUZ6_PETCI|nr:hypothetical protein Pcinc_009912 [Petrolisthes cinctipes]